MKTLKEICNIHCKLEINSSNCKSLIKQCTIFELRKEAPLALNTPTLGLHRIYFLPKDQHQIFTTFNMDPNDFKYEVLKCTSINKDFKTISNPFNLYIPWLLHSIYNSNNINARTKYDTMLAVTKLWNYRFFTGLSNHYFKYLANESVMNYTINNLSGKYEITNKETPTWRLLIQRRSESLVGGNSIHTKTIKDFYPDDKIFYIITDTNSRIRDTFKRINNEYRQNLEQGNKLESFTTVTTNAEGEKNIEGILESLGGVMDFVNNAVINEIELIDNKLIKVISGLYSYLKPTIFRKFLIAFSNLATQQHKDHEDKLEYKKRGDHLLIGYKILVNNIIQKTYRRCVLKNIDIKNKLQVVDAAKKMYSNSRINDEGLLLVKKSVNHMVNELSHISREQTKTAIKIGFILYILMLGMKHS